VPAGSAAPATPAAFLGAGAFGNRVAGLLAAARPGGRTFTDPGAAFSNETGPVIVALWRPAPALCERVDELAFTAGRPWLPVIMEHPVVRVGPLVTPPSAPCFACYQQRRRQHDDHRETTRLLHAAYDRDDACGPAGFLPQHARTAAAVAWAMLDAGQAGQVVTVRLTAPGLSAGRVLPVHGCARCSPPPDPVDLRALFRLRPGPEVR
jgi:bacteriocin biosynthesis cyclodehydratase domain-containing protein